MIEVTLLSFKRIEPQTGEPLSEFQIATYSVFLGLKLGKAKRGLCKILLVIRKG